MNMYARMRSLYENIKNRYEYRDVAPQDNIKIVVDPRGIKFKLSNRFYSDELPPNGTYVRDGNWDKNRINEETIYARKMNGQRPSRGLIKIKEMPLYQSFKSHFVHNVEWGNTQFYNLAQKMHEENHLISTKYGPNNIDTRLDYVDDLYTSIKENGFESSSSITVNIGRDGEIILGGDGLHRTILSKIIGVEQIPARIFVRHSEWQEKRYQAYTNNKTDMLPDSHPDTIKLMDQ